ncbi:MAG: Holliday junction resolvase RuvX [Chthoniobacterales bacterium]
MRILGIDHGDARIGLAISDELGMLAHPLETLNGREKFNATSRRICEVIAEKKIERVVIGLPRNMNGTYGPAAEKIREFADKLKPALKIPIILWDERMTTQQAQRSLHDAGRTVKNSRKVIDQVAAVIILQSYLDSMAPPLE